MKKAVQIEYVESCSQCPFSGWSNFTTGHICNELTTYEKPMNLVPIAEGYQVRPDCPLPDSE